MAKKILVDKIGEVTLIKRAGARGLRLSINVNGDVRVSMPHWLPYYSGLAFAKKRQGWIIAHKQKNQVNQLRNGSRIGKTYTLHIVAAKMPGILRTAINGQKIIVTSSYPADTELVQVRATLACERALLNEAKQALPPLLEVLANEHGFSYNELRIRKLSARWGSCSGDKVITLSYFLVQLPDEFIKYVMLHELAHTKHLNHSPEFWSRLDGIVPGAKLKRHHLRNHKPRLEPT